MFCQIMTNECQIWQNIHHRLVEEIALYIPISAWSEVAIIRAYALIKRAYSDDSFQYFLLTL